MKTFHVDHTKVILTLLLMPCQHYTISRVTFIFLSLPILKEVQSRLDLRQHLQHRCLHLLQVHRDLLPKRMQNHKIVLHSTYPEYYQSNFNVGLDHASISDQNFANNV